MNAKLSTLLGNLKQAVAIGKPATGMASMLDVHAIPTMTKDANRILSEIEYGLRVSDKLGGKHDGLLEQALTYLTAQVKAEGALTHSMAMAAEQMILPMGADAKKYRMIMVAHAHIDMNWQWGYDETVAITLDTFRTVLALMEEYPELTFAQSQGSTYKIVEDFDPDMLAEIKQRVHEGRWEISASTWVEADKNMPSAESMARHILYTKDYLSKLLDVCPDTLTLDFEPDTFGHSRNVPEILSDGGVKYYYHCRGYGGHQLYRWKAPSGKSVIAFREPFWYLGPINAEMAMSVPEMCENRNMDCVLKVYGVGDHGGGPTRRDVERILDMRSWPVFPTINFGTYKEYFAEVEKVADSLPVVEQELNFVFTGCYTTQSRIKLANRVGEANLTEGEALASLGHVMSNIRYPGAAFAKGWRHLLFNQFHDIITGSGVIETREYAMGGFQDLMATSNVCKTGAMRAIASMVDTSRFDDGEDISETISEGAGVGYDWRHFKVSAADRGAGLTRVFHVFNPTPYERRELVELTCWNWNGDKDRLEVVDGEGNPVPFQVVESGFNTYWGHLYFVVLVDATVPGMGYATYALRQHERFDMSFRLFEDHRTHHPDQYVLENERMRVTIDPVTGGVVSLLDKRDDVEMIDPLRPMCFRFIEEDTDKGMTSWTVGRYKSVMDILDEAKIRSIQYCTEGLRQGVEVAYEFATNSSLKAIITLDANRNALNYDVQVEFNELGTPDTCVPQLSFAVPLGYAVEQYRYDVPAGYIDRDELDMDVPANSYACGLPVGGGRALMLTSNCKYGFRCLEDEMTLTLIRGAYEPDPNPERGHHAIRLSVALVDDACPAHLGTMAYNLNNPMSALSLRPHKGVLPTTRSMMQPAEGTFMLSSVKLAEDGQALVVRVYDVTGKEQQVALRFIKEVRDAAYADILERPCDCCKPEVQGDLVRFSLGAYSMQTVRIAF